MMNKISLSALLLITSFFISTTTFAQAFQKGNANLDIGLGFGLYQTTASFTFDFFGEDLTIVEEDGSASFMLPVSFEYGIGEKIGIGAELTYSNYFIDDEDTTAVSETVRGLDFSLLVNYHLLDSDKNDLMLGLTLGGSNVKWDFEDGSEMKGTGSRFSIYIKDRLLLSENVGLLFQLGYISYNYDEISTSSENSVLENIDWELRGWNIGTGVAIKF